MKLPAIGTDHRSSLYESRLEIQTQAPIAIGPVSSSISHEDYEDQAALVPSLQDYKQNFLDYLWIWEVLACFFSAICLASIVGVLLLENGKQLDQWNLKLLPNVVVSFIATLAKTSLVLVISQILSQLKWSELQSRPLSYVRTYDRASRGPWGASILIFKSRRLVASMAAVSMLATLLVDPFIQLVFSFPIEKREDPHQQAILQRTQIYAPSGYYVSFLNPNGYSTSIPTDMSATINNAFNTAQLQYVNTCPSGNCTWPSIVTLGVCGSCQDITSNVSSSGIIYMKTMSNQTDLTCSYSYSSWPSLNLRAQAVYNPPEFVPGSPEYGAEDYRHVISTLWNSSIPGLSHHDPFRAQAGSKAVLGNFWGLQSKLIDPRISKTFPIKAVLCENYFCEKTLNISVSDGVVSVTKLDEEPLYLAKAWLDNEQSQHEIINLYKLEDINRTEVQPYKTEYRLGESLISQLTQTFSIASRKYQSLTNHDSGFWCEGPGCTTQAGSVLSVTTDFNATINRLSDFMTETIRIGQNSTNVNGTVFIMKTFIHVRWEWLGLPLGLLLLTSLLLAVVAIETNTMNTPAWKDNPLVLLFLQFDRVNTREPKDSKDLDTIARRLRARVSPYRPFTLVDVRHGVHEDSVARSRASSRMNGHDNAPLTRS